MCVRVRVCVYMSCLICCCACALICFTVGEWETFFSIPLYVLTCKVIDNKATLTFDFQHSTTTEGANHDAISISDISMNAQNGPRRSKLQKYPPRMFGVQQMSFCKSWLEQSGGWSTM